MSGDVTGCSCVRHGVRCAFAALCAGCAWSVACVAFALHPSTVPHVAWNNTWAIPSEECIDSVLISHQNHTLSLSDPQALLLCGATGRGCLEPRGGGRAVSCRDGGKVRRGGRPAARAARQLRGRRSVHQECASSAMLPRSSQVCVWGRRPRWPCPFTSKRLMRRPSMCKRSSSRAQPLAGSGLCLTPRPTTRSPTLCSGSRNDRFV